MKKLNKTFVSALFVAAMSMAGMQQATAFVPVIDSSAIIKQVDQIYELRKQVRAATDNGNFSALISNPTIRSQLNRYLPSKYNDIMDAVAARDTNALKGLMQKAAQEEASKRTTQSTLARALASQINLDVQNKVSVDRLLTRSKQLESMVAQLDSTANVAQKQDLTATIQAQSAAMQNEIAMVQLGMQKMQYEQQRANALLGSKAYVKERANTQRTLSTLFGSRK